MTKKTILLSKNGISLSFDNYELVIENLSFDIFTFAQFYQKQMPDFINEYICFWAITKSLSNQRKHSFIR